MATVWQCVGVFLCQCVRRLLVVRVCLCFLGSSFYPSHAAPSVIISALTGLFSCPDLCLKARLCASTPWQTSAWSSMVLSPTRKDPTISGWPTRGRFLTPDLALWVVKRKNINSAVQEHTKYDYKHIRTWKLQFKKKIYTVVPWDTCFFRYIFLADCFALNCKQKFEI